MQSKFGAPKIVNDGVTVAREIDLPDPVEVCVCLATQSNHEQQQLTVCLAGNPPKVGARQSCVQGGGKGCCRNV